MFLFFHFAWLSILFCLSFADLIGESMATSECNGFAGLTGE